MSKKREDFSVHLRNLVVSECKNGISYRKIAEKNKVSKSAVHKICKKYLQYNTVENLIGRGRKRTRNAYTDRRIVREIQCNPSTSRNIVETPKLNILSRTVRRRLKDVNLKSCLTRRKPQVNKVHKRERLAFAKKYVNKPLSFWKKIIWSDENKFELLNKQKEDTNEALKKQYLLPTVKYRGRSIMVWGCFSWHGVENLAPIHEIMTADKYVDILTENLEE